MSQSGRLGVSVAVLNDVDVVRFGVRELCWGHPQLSWVDASSLGLVDRPVDVALFDPFRCTEVDQGLVEALVRHPDLRTAVAFTWRVDRTSIGQALALGFDDCLAKGLPGADLQRRLVEIGHAGGRPDAHRESSLVGAGRVPRGDAAVPELSVREREMLRLIAAGLTNQQIAVKTFLSINSIKTYIRSAYRKIGVNRRSMAILWVLERQDAAVHEPSVGWVG